MTQWLRSCCKQQSYYRFWCLFDDLGKSNLGYSMEKSELLALECAEQLVVEGVLVVHKTKFLGVLEGTLENGEEFEESMHKIRLWACPCP